MQHTNFIQISGWLTKAENGFIWFHHEKPYKQHYFTSKQADGETEVIRDDVEWSSDGNYHCLGSAEELHVSLATTIAFPATLTISLN